MRHRSIGRWLGMAIFLVFTMLSISAGAQQSPRELFERARLLEENARNLNRAVEMYEQVVADAKADRALAAAAQLRIALAKERQGKPEARAVFAALVREYPEQRDIVSTARARLAASGAIRRSTELVPRRLRSETSFPVAFSPDGRQALVVTNETPTRIATQDVATGQMATLVPGTDTAWGRGPVYSPDGRQVAYAWLELSAPRNTTPLPKATTSLRLTGLDNPGKSRTLTGPAPGFFGFIPVGWSPDATAILVVVRTTQEAPSSLAWISVSDGSVRTIKTFESWRNVPEGGFQGPRGVTLAPDGKSISYSAAVREGSSERYIYVVDADGQKETTIVGIAGANTAPTWTPDGGHLLFINERSGRRGLWAVAVRNGAAAGEPRPIQTDFSGYLIDMPRSGELFYLQSDLGGFSEFIAERDPAGSRIVQTFKGQSGTWSKGNRLAFIRPGQNSSDLRQNGNDLIIRSIATGEERLYQHAGITNVSPRWLSDDSAVIVSISAAGDSATPGGAFYRVDVNTGAFTRLFARNTTNHERSAVAALSPDDKTLYLSVRPNANGPWTAIVAVDLATGAERQVVTFPAPGLSGRSAPGLAISPDGSTLAILTWLPEPSQDGRIVTVRTDGTEWRELHAPIPGGGWADVMRWTPDGQSIVYTEQVSRGPTGRWRVMQIPATGGEPQFDGLDSAKFVSTVPLPPVETGNVANIDLSPDGSRIVFGSRTIPIFDLWVLENVPTFLTR